MSNRSYFPESAHAHKWLDPLAENGKGVEIGGSQHNYFGISNCINVDYTADMDTIYKLKEIELCGEAMPVDVVAFADDLPFPDNHFDFLLNSHIFEHVPNSLKCLAEWHRVVKHNGIIYSIIPKRDSLVSDSRLPITTIDHHFSDYLLCETHETHPLPPGNGKHGHLHIYDIYSYKNLIKLFNNFRGISKFLGVEGALEIVDIEETDSKVKNGMTFVHRVIKTK